MGANAPSPGRDQPNSTVVHARLKTYIDRPTMFSIGNMVVLLYDQVVV